MFAIQLGCTIPPSALGAHAPQQVVIRVQGGQWLGPECTFELTIPALALSGTVRCDWRAPAPRFHLDDAPADEAAARHALEALATMLSGFHSGAFTGCSPEQLSRLYAADYHTQMSYAVGSPAEAARKGAIAELVLRLARPHKVLVAGCSAGECIRQLRARGVAAFGFDLCPDLERIVYPDVRAYVRQGCVTAIPFGPEDQFDTLTALDLFEHVPEDRVPAMVAELVRLGVRRVVALIAHCEFNYPGHVTLRPLSWWDEALAPAFRRVQARELAVPWPVVEPGSDDPTKLLRVWERAAP